MYAYFAFRQICVTHFSFENVIGPPKCVLYTRYSYAKIKHSFFLKINIFPEDLFEKSANCFTSEKSFNNCLTYNTIQIFSLDFPNMNQSRILHQIKLIFNSRTFIPCNSPCISRGIKLIDKRKKV